MPDLDTIRREIDGLHKQSTRTARELFMSECAAHWPTISAALAEAEEMRRKAERLQQIDEAFAQRSLSIAGTVASGKWIVHNHKVGTFASNDDLLTAIEAALAAKESK